jgi:probable rRNA maturation factor
MSEDAGIDVAVHVEDGVTIPFPPDRLASALVWAVEQEDVRQAEISIAFVGDEQIAALNQDYLHHDGATDVISFALNREGDPVLGDVYVGAAQAERQAAEHGEELEVELVRLALHGTLHVLGHEHPEDEAGRAESAMYGRQEELLAGMLARLRG